MICNDYQYDLINHPYLSEVVDASDGTIIQSFKVPENIQTLKGFRIKASKYGNPGPIHYKVGKTSGGKELCEGIIVPEKVLPTYETLVGDDFNPVSVEGGATFYLTLEIKKGNKPLDAYRLYGPNTQADPGNPGNTLIPYWWSEEYEVDDDMDIPLPQDYAGMDYPKYVDGSRFDKNGTQTWDLSFVFLTENDRKYPQDDELMFEFVRPLLSPPFSEWKYLRKEGAKESENEVMLDENWGLIIPNHTSPILSNSIEEIKSFFLKVMGFSIYGDKRKKNIVLEISTDTEVLPNEESFAISVEKDQVLMTAIHSKGLMRGIHWIEDIMLNRRAPILETGDYIVRSKYETRMVPGIYPAPSYFQLQEEQVWTRGYLWRLARAGYNSIYFQANLEELVEDSEIFPEMNDKNAPIAIERLRRMTELASQYGIEVYFDIKTGYYKPFSEEAYKRVPEIRTFKKWGNHPCGGQSIMLDFYHETVSNVFKKANKLKGMVVIYDTEGFYSCFLHNNKDRCPYCKDFSVEELSSRLFTTLQDAIKTSRDDAELILWSYFCDEPWNYQVIEAMPAGITLMACFSQFKELDRFGVKVRTDDYSICSEYPSEYFLKIQEIAKRKGVKFICKTEDTFGQEFVSTPYTPCLDQHQRRWDQVSQQNVNGYLAQYIHHGFIPGPCADQTRQNIYKITKNNQPIIISAEEKLNRTAVSRYGETASPHILKAWSAFSTAIRDFFPYTWGVCRYPGPIQAAPAQPFYFDPNRKVPKLRSRGYVKDLRWTGIDQRFLVDPDQVWDADLVSRCLQNFRHHYRKGLQHINAGLMFCEDKFKEEVVALQNIALTQYFQVNSLLNFIQFMTTRKEYYASKQPHLIGTLIYICENEMENASLAFEIAKKDSRLGYSCEGAGTVRGGLFTPYAIELKLSDLQKTLDELYQLKNKA